MNKKILKRNKYFSLITVISVVLGSSLLSLTFPTSNAGTITHNNGNVDISGLSDFGRILFPRDAFGFSFIGLVIDHDNYNHIPGSEDIADSFNTYPYGSEDDLKTVNAISMVVDTGNLQKSIASFQNQGLGTGDPDDILINQTAWTVQNKDWAILQWKLTNLKAVPLTGVSIGLEVPISKVGASGGGGPGGDNGDDVDGFDSGTATYWASDDSGTSIGFASAIDTDPLTHYYSEDYHSDYSSQYINFYSDETWLYNRIKAANATATDGINPGNITYRSIPDSNPCHCSK
jgi:hypothetical protein